MTATKADHAPDHKKITYLPASDLVPYANNARTHTDEQIAQIAASIREFGFTNPLLVDEKNSIIAGHGRLMASRMLKIDAVPTIILGGLTDAQKKALVIADNKLALNAGWDTELLKVEIGGLEDMGFDLSLTGFGEDELALFFNDGTEGLTDPDDVPEAPVDPISVMGDVWVLGQHRLMCGDSGSQSDVEKLLEGNRASVTLTDPPYGLGSDIASKKNNYQEFNDTRENVVELAQRWLPLAIKQSDAVVFSPGVTNQWIYPEPSWVICWFYGGGQLRSSWGFNCWQPFLCYGKDPSLSSGNGGRPDAVNLNVPANSADIDHPCPKPVALWLWLMERLCFSKTDTIYDPFSGSGTTLIAGEKKNIAVKAMEITPYYVDVAINRWQDFTGLQAVHAESGEVFGGTKAA
jgi:hypothetical protein